MEHSGDNRAHDSQRQRSQDPSHEDVTRRAYQLYEARGGKHGAMLMIGRTGASQGERPRCERSSLTGGLVLRLPDQDLELGRDVLGRFAFR
jgi:hypothetical protein